MILNGFYTSVERFGNSLLYRGYGANGNKIFQRIKYKPTLYISSKKADTKWKALDGTPVEPMYFDSMREAKEFKNNVFTKADKINRLLYEVLSEEE